MYRHAESCFDNLCALQPADVPKNRRDRLSLGSTRRAQLHPHQNGVDFDANNMGILYHTIDVIVNNRLNHTIMGRSGLVLSGQFDKVTQI